MEERGGLLEGEVNSSREMLDKGGNRQRFQGEAAGKVERVRGEEGKGMG